MDLLAAFTNITYQILLALKYVTVTILTTILTIIIYRLFFHPLARVPGPRLAAISNIWLAYQVRNGRAVSIGIILHKQYGQTVRVGPNEVWFNSKDAFKTIYSPGSRFEKSDFYLATALPRPDLDGFLRPHPHDSLDLLSERNMKRYRLQRRAIGPIYHPSNLIRHEPLLDAILDKAIARIRELNGEEVELKEWMHIVVVECLAAVVLGGQWSPGMLKRGTDSATGQHAYLGWRRKSVFGLFPLLMKISYLSSRFDRVFSLVWGIVYKPPKHFRTFFPDVGKRVSKRINIALHRQMKPGSQQDLMADLLEMHTKKSQDFTELYLKRMAVTNFGAGHETLASTLTSIFALLASHPDEYQAVADEVRAFGDEKCSFAEVMGQMQTLQAAVKEAKRLRPVIGMALPRTVPGSGAMLDGVWVPAGVTVGCHPTALHCNTDICGKDPEKYDLNRWLDGRNVVDGVVDDDDDVGRRVKDMDMYSLAWGGGSRMCPGRHLAELILYKVVARLVREFDARVDVPEEEAMPTYFVAMMTGVKVRFLTNKGG